VYFIRNAFLTVDSWFWAERAVIGSLAPLWLDSFHAIRTQNSCFWQLPRHIRFDSFALVLPT